MQQAQEAVTAAGQKVSEVGNNLICSLVFAEHPVTCSTRCFAAFPNQRFFCVISIPEMFSCIYLKRNTGIDQQVLLCGV